MNPVRHRECALVGEAAIREHSLFGEFMETQKEANAQYDTGCTNGAAGTGIRIENGLVDCSLQ